MPRRLDVPNAYGGTTDHSDVIDALRDAARRLDDPCSCAVIQLNLAADLLTQHDQSAIVLDDWEWGRKFVELITQMPVIPNLV